MVHYINRRYIRYNIGLVFLIACFIACTSMHDPYKEFIKDGSIVYPSPPDSVLVHPGKNRIQLSFPLPSDPSVSKARVYWHNGEDSVETSIDRTGDTELVNVILNGLEEGAYTFDIFTYDEEGNTSVKFEVLGTVYGEVYQQSLYNRILESMDVAEGVLILEWMSADDDVYGDEILYTDREGKSRQVFASAEDDFTQLDDIQPGSDFSYRTLFLPDSLAIDTFYTDYVSVEVDPRIFQTKLDKSNFEAFHLPTDTYEPYANENRTIDKTWDGNHNTGGSTTHFLTEPGTGLPQWFTFDLGGTAKLQRMKIYQRGTDAERLYQGGNVKRWEIWGSNDPNPDGSWDSSWILLTDGESVKPSGSPPGEMTEEDLNYILEGEEYTFPKDVPPVRYIRFKTIENWDSQNREYTNIGEFTFWGEETAQ